MVPVQQGKPSVFFTGVDCKCYEGVALSLLFQPDVGRPLRHSEQVLVPGERAPGRDGHSAAPQAGSAVAAADAALVRGGSGGSGGAGDDLVVAADGHAAPGRAEAVDVVVAVVARGAVLGVDGEMEGATARLELAMRW